MLIYVGTYWKYNRGSIFGEWLDPSDYPDKGAFIEACRALHKDEENPELMFQDHEGIPDGLISESSIDANLWEVLALDSDLDAAQAYLAIFETWDKEDFGDRFIGEYNSWEDMAIQFLEDSGQLQALPEKLRYYFDYEAYADDLKFNSEVVENNGYYFWNY